MNNWIYWRALKLIRFAVSNLQNEITAHVMSHADGELRINTDSQTEGPSPLSFSMLSNINIHKSEYIPHLYSRDHHAIRRPTLYIVK